MKVLFMFGGLPHYYNNILNKLNKIKGLVVTVIVPAEKSSTMGAGVFQKSEGIEFKLLKVEEKTAWYGKPMFLGFIKIIKEENPDIIVAIWPYILAFIYDPFLLFYIKKRKIKLMLKEIPFGIPKLKNTYKFYFSRNVFSEESPEEIIYPKNLPNYFKYAFLALSRYIYYNLCDAHVNYIEDAYEILSSYGVKKEKIFITYNSPDTDILFNAAAEADKEPDILPQNKYRIIHIGRLVKWKRVDLLINAAAQLKSKFPSVELVIIGEGPQKKELEKLAENTGVAEKIKWIGAVYNPVLLGRYFKVSSIYVLGGMGGLSINEAMSFGKPVICSIADGTEKKLVREDYNGKYFINGDLKDLLEKLEFLFLNPDLIDKMGKNSRKIIQEELNIYTVINGYLKAFNYVERGHLTLNTYEISSKTAI